MADRILDNTELEAMIREQAAQIAALTMRIAILEARPVYPHFPVPMPVPMYPYPYGPPMWPTWQSNVGGSAGNG